MLFGHHDITLIMTLESSEVTNISVFIYFDRTHWKQSAKYVIYIIFCMNLCKSFLHICILVSFKMHVKCHEKLLKINKCMCLPQ